MRTRFKLPSPAMTVACISLAVALSGASYAAITLPANSVGTKQLKRGAVTTKKVKNNAITGAKVNEATLGQVPSALNAANAANAQNAANANTLDGLDSSEFQTVGLSGSGDCDPNSATFVTCASTTFSFPRNGRAFIVATTDWESFAAASSGQCRIEVDGAVVPGTLVRPGETTDTTDNDKTNGAASTVVTDVLSGGSHTFALTCNELTANFDPDDAKISALMIGAA